MLIHLVTYIKNIKFTEGETELKETKWTWAWAGESGHGPSCWASPAYFLAGAWKPILALSCLPLCLQVLCYPICAPSWPFVSDLLPLPLLRCLLRSRWTPVASPWRSTPPELPSALSTTLALAAAKSSLLPFTYVIKKLYLLLATSSPTILYLLLFPGVTLIW